MARFRFELATPDDDAELRAILATTPMDGDIQVSFRREPDFFQALVVEGDYRQVIVCRDLQKGKIAGFGCRSIRDRYVNGQPEAVGYLSGLRALPEYRSRGLIARAYRYLHQLHADDRAVFYVSTIAEGNDIAVSALTQSRANLPAYHFLGMFHTVVIPLTRQLKSHPASAAIPGVKVRSGSKRDLPEIMKFISNQGKSRQLFPCYQSRDFFEPSCAFQGLVPQDLSLAFRDNRLIGILGGWDQGEFKQSVVERYAGHLRWSRPVYNLFAHLRRLPQLPQAGSRFRYLTGALPLIANNDIGVFCQLLEDLCRRAQTKSCDFLTLGLHEKNPLLPILQRWQIGCYLTRCYLVCWKDGESALARLENQTPYLELGAL